MSTWQVLVTAWDWEPSVLLGCAALLTAYVHECGWKITRQFVVFFSGIAVLAFALVSPLDTLGDYYLFSAHMVQHLLLVLIVPPLLLMGLPKGMIERARRWNLIYYAERVLARPSVAWIVGVGTIWVWHLPVLYEATLHNNLVHIFEHLSFLVTATIFWWPVFEAEIPRLSPLGTMIYLNAAGMATTFLGILLAFSPNVPYPSYANPVDVLGILPLIRQGWGLDVHTDQEIAGILMWVPGSFPYLLATFVVLARWFSSSETDLPKVHEGGGSEISRIQS